MAGKPVSVISRFWSKVDKNGPIPVHAPDLGRCWIWTSAKAGGYGVIGESVSPYVYKMHRAHRLSWEIHNGSIANGSWVLHKCDNKKCVNPNHLYLGDNTRNLQDALERGQKKIGADCSFAKLSLSEVIKARELHHNGMSQSKIAILLNTSRSVIQRAVSGRAYRNVPHTVPYSKGRRNLYRVLTEDQVREIRSTSREYSNKKLALKYGVGITTIHYIRTGEAWKHLS